MVAYSGVTECGLVRNVYTGNYADVWQAVAFFDRKAEPGIR
jgi:hypothetical protein